MPALDWGSAWRWWEAELEQSSSQKHIQGFSKVCSIPQRQFLQNTGGVQSGWVRPCGSPLCGGVPSVVPLPSHPGSLTVPPGISHPQPLPARPDSRSYLFSKLIPAVCSNPRFSHLGGPGQEDPGRLRGWLCPLPAHPSSEELSLPCALPLPMLSWPIWLSPPISPYFPSSDLPLPPVFFFSSFFPFFFFIIFPIPTPPPRNFFLFFFSPH